MERTAMQVNGSRPSLRSIRSSLLSLSDSIEDSKKWLNSSTAKRLGFGDFLKMMSVVSQLQAMRELIRERKEAITKKGKIHMCLKFPTLIRIRMIESVVDDLAERFSQNLESTESFRIRMID